MRACIVIVSLASSAAVADILFEDYQLNSSPLQSSARFGEGVAIEDDRIVVGSPGESIRVNGDNARSGVVYIFDRESGAQTARLTPSSGAWFETGYAVDLVGNTLVIGSPGDGEPGDLSNGPRDGGGYIIDLADLSQTEFQMYDYPPDEARTGVAVAAAPGRGLLMALKAQYQINDPDNGVYSREIGFGFESGSGAPTQVFAPLIERPHQGPGGIAIGSGVIAIGTPSLTRFPGGGAFRGGVHLFDDATGGYLETLYPTSPQDSHGSSLAIGGGLLVVGAPGTLGDAIYVYEIASRTLLYRLIDADIESPDADSNFGESIAISNGLIVVGAPTHDNDDVGYASGRAYVIEATTGDLVATLQASDAIPSAFFGDSVDIFGNTVVVGAPEHRYPGEPPLHGAAYVFTIPLDCACDIDGNGVTNTADITFVVSNLGAGSPGATGTPGDADGDGLTTTADITLVVSNLGTNCAN
ncbi:MAG: hypothetical protein AAGD00_03565 [Planctomycetota bacterium]